MQPLNTNSSPQQTLSHTHFLVPLSADTHLMDPVPVPLPLLYHHTSKVTASPAVASPPPPVFLCSYSVSLSFSLPLLWPEKERERILAPAGNPQLQTDTYRLWSLTAAEAHRSSRLTELWKWWKEANVATRQPAHTHIQPESSESQ